MHSPLSIRILSTSAWVALSMVASAQTWSGTLNGTAEAWNVNGNWAGGTFPNSVGAAVSMNVDFSANKLSSLDQGITVGTLTMGDSSGPSTLGINTGTGTNTLSFDNTGSTNAALTSSGGSNTISTAVELNDSLDLTLNSALSLSGVIFESGGAKGLVKGATSGSLTLSGNNSFSGGITHRQGTINLGGSANAVLGTGAFTFANLSGGSGNTLAFNAANSRTIANNFVNDNAAAVPGAQYSQISFSGGVTGNRIQTFTGTFSTGAGYFTGTNPQSLLFEAQGSAATTADEGSIVLQGSWAGYAGGAANGSAIRIGENSSSDGGSVLIDAATAIAASGGYQIQGNSPTVGTKLILNGAYAMANGVNFAGGAGGARSSFGARNAAATTATLSGNVSLSDADGAGLFAQNSGATLVVSGQISGSNPLEINRAYTFTSANGTNTTETPAGTVMLTATNTYSGTTTVTGGTLQIGSGGTTGRLTATGAITNNGNLTINRSNAFSQATDLGAGTAITGSGSLT